MKRLILAFHGLGGSGRQLRRNSQLDPVAEELGGTIHYPDAPLHSWPWYAKPDSRLWRWMVGEVETWCDGFEQVALVGFSAGANLAARLLYDHVRRRSKPQIDPPLCNQLVGGVVYAGEWRSLNWSPAPPVLPAPTIFLGSTDDRFVPIYSNALVLAGAFGTAGQAVHLPSGNHPLWGGHVWLPEHANPLIQEHLARAFDPPIDAERKLVDQFVARLESLCAPFATPASVTSTHRLANQVLGIVREERQP